ncbi:MAG: transglycosylase domain-containing protein [Myxococcales bacterium]|nr:transglycosylase domain-containing protein [Myxococcales bacterium]
MRRALWIITALLLLTVVGAVVAAVVWGPGYVEAELRRRAAARGWQVEWASMSLAAGPVEFEAVRLSRGPITVTLDRLAVIPRWQDLGAGMPVERVEAEGATVTLDLAALADSGLTALDLDPATADVAAPRDPAALPPVSLHRLRVIARHDGRAVAEAAADVARWLPGEPEPLRLAGARLHVETPHGRLDAPAQRVRVDPITRIVTADGITRLKPGAPPQIPSEAIEVSAPLLSLADGIRLDARALGGDVTLTLDGPPTAPLALHLDARDLDLAAALAPLTAHRPLTAAGRLDLALTIYDPRAQRPPSALALTLTLRDGTLTHPALAPEPLDGIEGTLHLLIEHTPDGWHLDGEATTAGVTARGTLTADTLGPLAHLRLRAALDPVPCDVAYAALPRALRGPYADARFDTMEPDARGNMKRAGPPPLFAPTLDLDLPLDHPFDLRFRPTGIAGACPVSALHATALPPALRDGDKKKRGLPRGIEKDVAWLLEDFTHPVPADPPADRVGPGDESWVDIDTLPAYIPAVMYLSEDRSLFERPGALDMKLISRALKFDLQRGRYVYGGSTLPQQLVKNLFLARDKTLARKLQEAIIANRVTVVVPPERILALYINCIEFAPGVYGLRRAAWHYFGVPPEALTPKQAVFLATAKPSPAYADTLRKRGYTPDTPHYRRYMRRLFDRLVEIGALTEADVQAEGPLQVTF